MDASSSADGAESLLRSQIFVNIVVSLAATYGIWLIASLLFVSSRAPRRCAVASEPR